MPEKQVERLDPNMRPQQSDDGLHWIDLRELTVEGRGWSDTESFYDRLPARAKVLVRDPVWELSRHSAGIAARFISDAPAISARWRLRHEALSMYHMPSTGMSGIDLYAHHQDQWRWMGISRQITYPQSTSVLAEKLTPESRHCMVYLPLYNGVESVEIGVPRGAALAPDPRPPQAARPICFYGTSITQGGCASRPGMAYPAILGRWLDRPTINLGFSGNGRMEPEMADLLAELDPDVYVIDCLPNMSAEPIEQRVDYLVSALRRAHPDTPLVFVENIPYTDAPFKPDRDRDYRRKNEAQNRALDQCAGVHGIHRVSCENLIGRDGEGTVDGTHPTDVGFARMAETLEPALRQVMTGSGR